MKANYIKAGAVTLGITVTLGLLSFQNFSYRNGGAYVDSRAYPDQNYTQENYAQEADQYPPNHSTGKIVWKDVLYKCEITCKDGSTYTEKRFSLSETVRASLTKSAENTNG